MELQKAIKILSEHKEKLLQASLSDDRVVTNPVVEALDVVIDALKHL